jgi:hypothetical protein
VSSGFPGQIREKVYQSGKQNASLAVKAIKGVEAIGKLPNIVNPSHLRCGLHNFFHLFIADPSHS